MAKATKASTKKRSSKKASAKRSAASTPRPSAAKATKKTAKKAAKKVAKTPARPSAAAKKAATKTAKKSAKKAAKATPKPVKKAAAKSAKKSAKKTAKKTAKPAQKPAAAKSSRASAAAAPAKAVAKKPAAGTKGTVKKPGKKKRRAAGTQTAWNAVSAAATPPAPRPVVAEIKEAPKKFQRQYKTWLERLLGLRRRLLGETSQLEEEALKAGEHDVSIDHMADYGSDSYEQEFTLSLIESKSEALRDVDEAIRKIEAGTYGLCEDCETLIPKGRLEVLPHTRLCIECKSAQESASGF